MEDQGPAVQSQSSHLAFGGHCDLTPLSFPSSSSTGKLMPTCILRTGENVLGPLWADRLLGQGEWTEALELPGSRERGK